MDGSALKQAVDASRPERFVMTIPETAPSGEVRDFGFR